MPVNPWRGPFFGSGQTKDPVQAYINSFGGTRAPSNPADAYINKWHQPSTWAQFGGNIGPEYKPPTPQPRIFPQPPQPRIPQRDFSGLAAYLNTMLRADTRQLQLLHQHAGAERGFASRALDLANRSAALDYDRSAWGLNQRLATEARDRDFIRRALGLDIGRLGIERRMIPLDRSDREMQFARANRQLEADYTRRGAWFAPERLLSARDLRTAFENDLARLGLREEDIGLREQLRRLSGEREMATLDDEVAQARSNLDFLRRAYEIATGQNRLSYDRSLSDIDFGLLQSQRGIQKSMLNTMMNMPPEVWSSIRSKSGFWQKAKSMFGRR